MDILTKKNNLIFKKVLITALLLLCTPILLNSQQLLVGSDKIAKVNNKIITLKELKEMHDQLKLFARQTNQQMPSEKEVLQMMIDQELLKAEVKNSNIILDEARYNQQLQAYKNQFTQQMTKSNPSFEYSDAVFIKYIEDNMKADFSEFENKLKDRKSVV